METHTHTQKQNLSLQCSHSFLFTVSSVLYPWGKHSSGGLNPWNENICSILSHHLDVYLFVNYIPNIFKVESCGSLMVFLKCSLHFIWFFILQLLFLPKKYVVVQLLSRVQLFVTSQTEACQASLSPHSPLELTQVHFHWVGDAI